MIVTRRYYRCDADACTATHPAGADLGRALAAGWTIRYENARRRPPYGRDAHYCPEHPPT